MVPLKPSRPGEDVEAHAPVLPDFLVSTSTGGQAVVETMGYDLPAYRDRKARLHPAMRQACAGARLIEHDFCSPAEWSQDVRDRVFRRALRDALLGGPPARARIGA